MVGIDNRNPASHLFVEFDNTGIGDWLAQTTPLPSAWMDLVQPANPAIEEKRLKLATELVELFFEAIELNDLHTAQLLYDHHGVDPEALNADGKSALHLASQKGFHKLILWLLDEAAVDIDHPDSKGYRAIHYAILGYNSDINYNIKKNFN